MLHFSSVWRIQTQTREELEVVNVNVGHETGSGEFL